MVAKNASYTGFTLFGVVINFLALLPLGKVLFDVGIQDEPCFCHVSIPAFLIFYSMWSVLHFVLLIISIAAIKAKNWKMALILGVFPVVIFSIMLVLSLRLNGTLI
jgi:hypothetical protein